MEKTESRRFEFPKKLEDQIVKLLSERKINLSQTRKIAECVLRHSDYYITNPQAPTPWDETWAQIAQIAYFLPLNYLRFAAVTAEALRKNFFQGLEHFFDFGSGLGVTALNLEPHFDLGICIENNPIAERLHKSLQKSPKLKWTQRIYEIPAPKKTLATFSYSLTEISEIPEWARGCEALLIVEPSTHQDSRRLLEFRQKLLDEGFSMWAPCTHQMECPLLKNSKRDWCHDRVHWNMPEWFQKIENELPIKNKTVTFSYLLARKMVAPNVAGKARLVGDILEEKGKSKVMVCRNDNREFLSWLHKDIKEQALARGMVIEVPTEHEIKSNEIRIKKRI